MITINVIVITLKITNLYHELLNQLYLLKGVALIYITNNTTEMYF